MPSRAALQASQAATERKINDDKTFKVASDFVKRKVTKMFAGSALFTEDNFSQMPSFTNKEMVYGRVLGRGGFGIVNDVKSLTIDKSVERADTENCKALASQCVNPKTGAINYAIKQLSTECKCDANKLVQGIMDMAVETYFLSSLSHPNIIKLNANRVGDIYHHCYFVIMDKLTETLEQRLFKWKQKSTKLFRKTKDKDKQKYFRMGLGYGIDIASALEYLHEMR